MASEVKEVSRAHWIGYGVRAFDRGLRWGLALGGILGASIAWAVWSRLMGCE